jgi:hypothetical protein
MVGKCRRNTHDRTEASAGHPIHLNTFEGLSALPMEVDDEVLTVQGAFSQPSGTGSALSGFIGCVELFPYMAECIARQRRHRYRASQGDGFSAEDVRREQAWIDQTRGFVDAKMERLPRYLRDPSWVGPGDETTSAVIGMQRANILVTEASVHFALVSAG